MRRVLVLVLLWLGALSAPAAADNGPWGWPLPGAQEVARPFAPPASAYGAGHRGVDLPAAPGAAVRASASGRVSYAGLLAGRGVVVVTHGALRTTYEPVTALVDVGQAVVLGEPLGRLEPGHLGCPVEACLHWGLRRGEQYLDPVRLVVPGPVRLLPLGGPGAATAGAASGGRTAAATASSGAAGGGLPAGDGSGAKGATGAGAGRFSTQGPGAPDGSGAGRGGAAAGLPAAAEGPSWSVRASEAPLGVAAVAALVVGIGLLARPAPTRPGPPGPPAAPSDAAVAAGPAPPFVVTTTAPPPVLTAAAPELPAPSTSLPVVPAAAAAAPAPVSSGADVLELSVERARRRPA